MVKDARGHLLQVDLHNGIIKARMKEGFFKERDIEINIGQDPEFLRDLARELGVLSGDRLENVRSIQVGRMTRNVSVQEHEIRIIIQ